MENKSFDIPWEWRAMDLRLGGVKHGAAVNQHAYNAKSLTLPLRTRILRSLESSMVMVSGQTEVFYELLCAWAETAELLSLRTAVF